MADPHGPAPPTPTDLDAITGHPFESTGQWDDCCERLDSSGWMCGYSRAEHVDQGAGDADRP
jgi:hypothetical protein